MKIVNMNYELCIIHREETIIPKRYIKVPILVQNIIRKGYVNFEIL
jgi:hypothetical protein